MEGVISSIACTVNAAEEDREACNSWRALFRKLPRDFAHAHKYVQPYFLGCTSLTAMAISDCLKLQGPLKSSVTYMHILTQTAFTMTIPKAVLPDLLTKKSMKTHNTQDSNVNYNIRLLKNARYSFILSIQRNTLAIKIPTLHLVSWIYR